MPLYFPIFFWSQGEKHKKKTRLAWHTVLPGAYREGGKTQAAVLLYSPPVGAPSVSVSPSSAPQAVLGQPSPSPTQAITTPRLLQKPPAFAQVALKPTPFTTTRGITQDWPPEHASLLFHPSVPPYCLLTHPACVPWHSCHPCSPALRVIPGHSMDACGSFVFLKCSFPACPPGKLLALLGPQLKPGFPWETLRPSQATADSVPWRGPSVT